MECQLHIENGPIYSGKAFGHLQSCSGELVFMTNMVGYPQALTDPSYHKQMIVSTYPLIGSYGVNKKELESNRIWAKALIIQTLQPSSHAHSNIELDAWLKEEQVVGIQGIDTRELTQYLREHGSCKAKIVFTNADIPFVDINSENLVANVSTTKVIVHTPSQVDYTIIAMDFGMKKNQITNFLNRNIQVIQVPYNFNIIDPIRLKSLAIDNKQYTINGLFLSNGPGDPSMVKDTIQMLSTVIKSEQTKEKPIPIFGICLGHQLFALAAGGTTSKMQYGNRGMNIPVLDKYTHKCHISSQNHGYAVNKLPNGFDEWFINANDQSNEGLIHPSLPWATVQFHPEHHPGPHDTEFLFDLYKKVLETNQPFSSKVDFISKRVYAKKVLVLGSGGLSIGQAGEFDYSGSQAIKALKEEGIYTILINPNIATIQTSKGLADKVYFLPITPEFVRKVIIKERPDGIYCTFGGQTALNIGVKMKDEFSDLGVTVLGTPINTIIMSEDRDMFAEFLRGINEPTANNKSADNLEDAIAVANEIGYPVICRAAYALGGLGSGFADNAAELRELAEVSLKNSPQVLLEKSFKGWQEFEYEVVRDAYDNCITVCNMENLDPLGIHTGDSIVVAPSQTLSDNDHQKLRNTAINVIRQLGVIGECNIQYAVDPITRNYFIIEVNARLSRSSALASKATGYPLAFVAAKLGLGIPLYEIKNNVTLKTCACFEPSLDYIVIKMPRWDLRKFNRVSSMIGTSMKSVGEVMAIGRTFEEAIQKAIRAVEASFVGFESHYAFDNLEYELHNPTDRRLFAVAYAMEQGYSVETLNKLTNIDPWFLNGFNNIMRTRNELVSCFKKSNSDQLDLPFALLLKSKQMGFSDAQIGKCFGLTSEIPIRKLRIKLGITPFVKQIDTVAAEFPAYTNYLYMTYNGNKHDLTFNDHGVIILGSGVYRIGSSVEFDWCAVKTVRTLRKNKKKTIMINYNPETVSTDFDEADRLYFENLTLERVMDIYDVEQSQGVVLSMGGQSPNNIALPLFRQHVKIFGTSPEMIDNAENRYKFSRLLDSLQVDQPLWKELTDISAAYAFCEDKYPVLVRPSYVLSGAAMNVVFGKEDLSNFLSQAVSVSPEFPVVISKFIENAKEIEMDAVAKDGNILAMVVSEHVENAGVHSGDATLILPPQDLSQSTINKIQIATKQIANALNVTGPLNIQFIAKDDDIKVIECNVRASRSFPFCSKVLDFDLIELATLAIMHLPIPYNVTENGIIIPTPNYVAVKVPKFSFNRLSGADPTLGVEMSSTGEVACFGNDKYEAYLKGLLAATFILPKKNILLSIGSFNDKMELLPSILKLHQLGFKLFATSGTADFISSNHIPVQYLELSNFKEAYNLQHYLQSNLIDLYINLPSKNQYRRPASYMSNGYKSRRMAIDYAIPLITNIKCCKLFVEALSRHPQLELLSCDVINSHDLIKLTGLVGIYTGTDIADATLLNGLVNGFTTLVTTTAVTTSSRALYSDVVAPNIGYFYLDCNNDFDTINAQIQSTTFALVVAKQSHAMYAIVACQINNKSLHILNCDQLDMIHALKQKMRITCDVDYTLINQENIHLVDCISFDNMTPVSKMLQTISVDQLIEKCYTNPCRIFQLQPQLNTWIIIEDTKIYECWFKNQCVFEQPLSTNKTIAKNGVYIKAQPQLEVKVKPLLQIQPKTPLMTSPVKQPQQPQTVQSAFINNHLINVDHLQRQDLHYLFGIAHEMRTFTERHEVPQLLQGRVLGIAFFEPSTRTNCSFQAAWGKMGGSCMVLPGMTSQIKGENLVDTIRTISSYADIVVMRHKDENSVRMSSKVSSVPMISGGEGSQEHPTQALLDVYTIREELGTVNNLNITLVGDLMHGRTVHSLVKLLMLYKVKLNFVSPNGLEMPQQLLALLEKNGIGYKESAELTDGILETTDVLYVTRMQKERMEGVEVNAYYHITPLTLSKCKQHMIVMHPLPRVDEIDPMVDEDDRAAYFRQMRYGLYVRMALLALITDVY